MLFLPSSLSMLKHSQTILKLITEELITLMAALLFNIIIIVYTLYISAWNMRGFSQAFSVLFQTHTLLSQ